MLENMRDLKEKLNYILNFIDDKDNVVFLDYPLHHNVGDMLIFLGTNEFFKKNNYPYKTVTFRGNEIITFAGNI